MNLPWKTVKNHSCPKKVVCNDEFLNIEIEDWDSYIKISLGFQPNGMFQGMGTEKILYPDHAPQGGCKRGFSITDAQNAVEKWLKSLFESYSYLQDRPEKAEFEPCEKTSDNNEL